jgi:hypothetical protein
MNIGHLDFSFLPPFYPPSSVPIDESIKPNERYMPTWQIFHTCPAGMKRTATGDQNRESEPSRNVDGSERGPQAGRAK